ncbi:hypothetical protein LCGC14_0834570 [marine sediment metagenome]|uniref:Uncharacterized protein n=1 Tax=marine sediment metagenome TaxID=412755 RepID=A0A0F9PJN4_9ZZZZ
MGNGELQPEGVTPRKSRIQMGIQRTLSTAQYETLVIHYDIDEEITWTTPTERSKKVRNWETVLLQEFKGAHDRIMEELNLSHKKAYFKAPPPSKKSLDPLDCLDDLDTLG